MGRSGLIDNRLSPLVRNGNGRDRDPLLAERVGNLQEVEDLDRAGRIERGSGQARWQTERGFELGTIAKGLPAGRL